MLLSVEERNVNRMILKEKPTLDAAVGLEAGAGLDELRQRAGWMPLRETGWISITGEDRVRWLNGMVTNSVQALQPGEGAYCFLLNAQGRIQGDGTVWAEASRLLIETDRAQVEPMIALLDRFIIMDDVLLEDVTRQANGIELAGPGAQKILHGLGLEVAAGDGNLRRVPVTWQGENFDLIAAYSPLIPRFEMWTDSAAGCDALAEGLRERAAEALPESFELLRVLERRPVFGRDIRDRDLAQETAQTRALHFQKGCYLGQEIVERIRSRGQVHRSFTGFALHGAVPPPGTELQADGKTAGTLTTVARAEIYGERLALGYIRRDVLERGAVLSYTFGETGKDGPLTGSATAEARGTRGASKG